MKKLCFFPLLFLTACSTTKPLKLVLRPEQPPPAANSSAIRYPEVVRAYHVGRYVDPNDDMVMHERHVIYRVEENSRWNLHPGPLSGDLPVPAPAHAASFSPAPVNDAVVAEVNEQTLATAQIILEARKLTAALAQFRAALQQTQTNWQEVAELRLQVGDVQRQLDELKIAQARLAAFQAAASTNPPPARLSDTNFPYEHEFSNFTNDHQDTNDTNYDQSNW